MCLKDFGWFFLIVVLSRMVSSVQVMKQEETVKVTRNDCGMESLFEKLTEDEVDKLSEHIHLRLLTQKNDVETDELARADEEIANLTKAFVKLPKFPTKDLAKYIKQEFQKSVVKRAAYGKQISSSSKYPPKVFHLDKYKKRAPAPLNYLTNKFSKKYKFSKREADPEPEPEPEPEYEPLEQSSKSSYQSPGSYYSYRNNRELASIETMSKKDAKTIFSKRKSEPEPLPRTREDITISKDESVKTLMEGKMIDQTIFKQLSKMIKTAKQKRRFKRSEDNRKKPSFYAPDFSYTVEDVSQHRRKRHANMKALIDEFGTDHTTENNKSKHEDNTVKVESDNNQGGASWGVQGGLLSPFETRRTIKTEKS